MPLRLDHITPGPSIHRTSATASPGASTPWAAWLWRQNSEGLRRADVWLGTKNLSKHRLTNTGFREQIVSILSSAAWRALRRSRPRMAQVELVSRSARKLRALKVLHTACTGGTYGVCKACEQIYLQILVCVCVFFFWGGGGAQVEEGHTGCTPAKHTSEHAPKHTPETYPVTYPRNCR